MNGWHADEALLDRYASGVAGRVDSASLEAHVLTCPECRARLGERAEPARLERNFEFVVAELDAPKRGRTERLLVRAKVPDHIARLMMATPALRWSWFAAVLVALTFAGSAVSSSGAHGADRLVSFLAVAPLGPVLGVALCYGPGVDPTHEVAVAAPMDGFRLLMIRSVTVLGTSIVITGVSALTQPVVGLESAAWLVPALALSVLSLALSTFCDGRVAAGVVAGGWITAVILASRIGDDVLAAFSPFAQLVMAAIGAAALAVLITRRRRFDVLEAVA